MSKFSKEWRRFVRRIRGWFGLDKSGGDAKGPTPPALNWCWGGLNGSKAVEVDNARIRNLRVTNDGLSYEWEYGGCEALGALSEGDYDNTLACLFLSDGRGGKFDWISTNRRTRDFKNIKTCYRGWNPASFVASKRVWFCICSKDGKNGQI